VINIILRYLGDLRAHTALLEAMNWDEELTAEFVDELNTMLMAAPPNVEKALFWLRNTPWDCFEDGEMPETVYYVVEGIIRSLEQDVKAEIAVNEKSRFALQFSKNNANDSEWN
jgi:hypothetical protein